MNRVPSKKNTLRFLLLLLIVASLLLATLPGGAQTVSSSCIATATGTFSCPVEISSRTTPGQYNLVATCPQGGANGAVAYPPTSSSGTLTVSATSVPAGSSTTVSGTGCLANQLVTITLERVSALAGVFGGVANAQATGIRTLTARITVTGAAGTTATSTAAPKGRLTATGIDAMPWLLSAIAALAVGSAFVLVGRRRIRKSSSASA